MKRLLTAFVVLPFLIASILIPFLWWVFLLLAVAAFVLDAVEMFTDRGNPVGVANSNNGMGQLFGPQVEVVNGPPFVDNQFRFLDTLHKKGLKRLFQISDKYHTFAHPVQNGKTNGPVSASWRIGRGRKTFVTKF